MPHSRKRHVIAELARKLKFSRIVTLQGPRQCGKSFFARELLASEVSGYQYVTLDIKEQRVFAQKNPATFLARFQDASTLAIDEAQKSPDLFDEIKAKVDTDQRTGQFLLLGSTEFSREALIRESLTGRVSRTRIFPLNLSEAFEKVPNGDSETHHFNPKSRFERKDLSVFLSRGGLPGIFAIRSETEREQKLQEWLEVTAYRDLGQFKKLKTDPELALSILETIATLEFPSLSDIRSKLKRDLRIIKRHLELLTQLFAIQSVSPHPAGSGQNLYFLCDPGLAIQLGASFQRALETWVLLELQSQASYQGRLGLKRKLYYYRSQKKAWVSFVVEGPQETLLLDIHPEETWVDQDLRALRACAIKLGADHSKNTKLKSVFLHGGADSYQVDSMLFYPWESIG